MALPTPKSQNPEIRLDFFARMLDIAVFPRLSRHSLAAAAGVIGRPSARGWIRDQVRERVRNPEWRPKDSVGRIEIVFALLFRRIPPRRPLHSAPAMAPAGFRSDNGDQFARNAAYCI